VAFFDVEVVDRKWSALRPTTRALDFKLEGPAIWRGGVNSAKQIHNNLWLDTECGVNRVAIRSTLTPGHLTLTARAPVWSR